jgi:hypothetical protein
MVVRSTAMRSQHPVSPMSSCVVAKASVLAARWWRPCPREGLRGRGSARRGFQAPRLSAASDSRALEVVLSFEQLIESLSFLLFDEAKTDAGKKVHGDFLDFHFPCSCQKK